MAKTKNPAAVALGKLGGKAEVPKGFAMTDPSAAGKKGAAKRWGSTKKKKAAKKNG
jgi:hypothetical protein